VNELREAIENNQRLARSARVLREDIFDRTAKLNLTQEQKHDAKDQYDKALDTLGDTVKDFTFHPFIRGVEIGWFSRAY